MPRFVATAFQSRKKKGRQAQIKVDRNDDMKRGRRTELKTQQMYADTQKTPARRQDVNPRPRSVMTVPLVQSRVTKNQNSMPQVTAQSLE